MSVANGGGAARLEWGLRQSFRAYVESAGGVVELGGGVQRTQDGAFVFAAAQAGGLKRGADGRPQGTGRYLGSVRFEAHMGMLEVVLADPAVEIGPGGATITVFDSLERERRVALAELDLAGAQSEAGGWLIPARLARDGWQVLGDHYPPGAPLDPVRVRIG